MARANRRTVRERRSMRSRKGGRTQARSIARLPSPLPAATPFSYLARSRSVALPFRSRAAPVSGEKQMSKHQLSRVCALAAAAALCVLLDVSAALAQTTLRVVKHSDLKILD